MSSSNFIIKAKVNKTEDTKLQLKKKKTNKTNVNTTSNKEKEINNNRAEQHIIAGFAIPRARVFSKLKYSVYREAFSNSFKEIEAGEKNPNKAVPISKMSKDTINCVKKAREMYASYLSSDKVQKEIDNNNRSIQFWKDLKSDHFQDNEGVFKVDKESEEKVYEPDKLIVDKYKGLNEWRKAIALLKRHNLKYGSHTGTILAIFINELIRQWFAFAIDNCSSKSAKTVSVHDFIYKVDNNGNINYLEDLFHDDKYKNNLLLLALNYNTYRNAKNDIKKELILKKEKKKQKKNDNNPDNSSESNSNEKQEELKEEESLGIFGTEYKRGDFKHYVKTISLEEKEKLFKEKGHGIKFKKEVWIFGSDIIDEFINKVGTILRHKMNFFCEKTKSKTVGFQNIIDTLNTLTIYNGIDNQIYEDMINDKLERFEKFLKERREFKKLRREELAKLENEKESSENNNAPEENE